MQNVLRKTIRWAESPRGRRRLACLLLLVLVCTAVSAVALPHGVYAESGQTTIDATRVAQGSTAQSSSGPITWLISKVAETIMAVLAFFMTALMWLVKFAADLVVGVINVTNFQNVPIVDIGWHITLDFVNLLFILILLVIGFATIFRMETYGIKALLPRLIIIALLINFSKVIAGVILDVGNLLTTFFLSPMGDTKNLSVGLMNLLNLQKSFDADIGRLQQFASGLETLKVTGAILFGELLGIVVMATAALTLLFFAIIFVVRIIWLWLLVIVAPLAWIAMILPGTRRFWSMWWSNFIKWVMIAPILVFFLYLLSAMGQNADGFGLTRFVSSLDKVRDAPGGSGGVSTFAGDPRFMLQYAIVIGFLLAGPMAASQLGAAGAAGVLGMASAGQRWMLSASGRAALAPVKGGAKFAGDRAQQRAAPYLERWGQQLAGAKWTKYVPGAGAVARLGIHAGEQNRAKIQEARKEAAPLSTQALVSTIESLSRIPGITNENKRLGFITELANRRDRDTLSVEDQTRASTQMQGAVNIGRARKDYESIKPLLAANPQFAKDSMEMGKAVREAVRTGADKNWDASVYEASQKVSLFDKDGNKIMRTNAAGVQEQATEEAGVLAIQTRFKEMGESPQALQRQLEGLGKRERDAARAAMRRSYQSGDHDNQFNSMNSDFREVDAALAPEELVEAVSEFKLDPTTGTMVRGEVEKSFAKGLAKGMQGQELERFFAKNFENIKLGEEKLKSADPAVQAAGDAMIKQAEENLNVFEAGRGQTRLEDVKKSLQRAGVIKKYTQGLANRRKGIATYDEFVGEDNEARRYQEAFYTGDTNALRMERAKKLSWLLAEKDHQKRREKSKYDKLQVSNFITSLKGDNAEEFGKEANDAIDKTTGTLKIDPSTGLPEKERSQSRKDIAQLATASQMPDFLQNMTQAHRKKVIESALAEHPKIDPKTGKESSTNKTYRNFFIRNPYLSTHAAAYGIDLGKAQREYEDVYTEREATKEYLASLKWAGTGFTNVDAAMGKYQAEVDKLRDQLADATKRPTQFEATNMLPKTEEYSEKIAQFASNIEDRADQLDIDKDDLPDDKKKDAAIFLTDLQARQADATGHVARHQIYVNVIRRTSEVKKAKPVDVAKEPALLALGWKKDLINLLDDTEADEIIAKGIKA